MNTDIYSSDRSGFDRREPIRLALAARIAFPDGSIGVKSLRRQRDAGRLVTEMVGGKEFTTLAAIEEMRGLCRVHPSRPVSSGETNTRKPRPDGTSNSGGGVSPQAAAEARLMKLIANSQNSSPEKSIPS